MLGKGYVSLGHALLIFYHDDVGKPSKVPNFFDKLGLKELVHLLPDYFVSLFLHLPLLL